MTEVIISYYFIF